MGTEARKIDFLFDFGSPNAYLAHRLIPGIEHRTGLQFSYIPVLLGGIFKATNNQSPFDAFAQIKNKLEYEEIETQRFVARHGIAGYSHNPFFPINTLVLMRGAIAAQRLDVFEKYVDEIFNFMWSNHRKLDDLGVLMSSMKEVGLPADKIAELAQDAAVKQELIDNTTNAVGRGAFGAPTFFIGDEIFFGKDRLRDLEEAALSPEHAD